MITVAKYLKRKSVNGDGWIEEGWRERGKKGGKEGGKERGKAKTRLLIYVIFNYIYMYFIYDATDRLRKFQEPPDSLNMLWKSKSQERNFKGSHKSPKPTRPS
jgi:hypothetical protein